jgi:hypothetical protein
MTTRIVTALTLGFFASIVLFVPVTTAEECYVAAGEHCFREGFTPRSKSKVEALGTTVKSRVTCCRDVPTKTAPVGGGFEERMECEKQGKQYDPATNSCHRPVKNIGTSKTTGESSSGETPAALKPIRDCKAKGWLWDPATNECNPKPVKNIGKAKNGEASTDDTPAALKPIRDCKAKGWRWETSGKCVKPSEVKADCEAKGHQYDIDTGRCIKSLKPTPQTSDESDDDYKPKKKNKRKKHDD